ncbi:MarR family transcriptional regulator [Streptomyces sp. NPDC101118]|uniref:MarR family transcriptional regulator n=1 Tax=Streptomyces sp. NPDC101118 TaxID=3366109 RepID=UPI003828B65E
MTGLDLARALTEASRDRLSGELLVSGEPGGSFHLRSGALLEVASPGAPGVETLLLRSGRVSEAEWASVTRSAAGDGRLGTALIAQDLVGSAELQLMCTMAALDGALAVGMGRINGFTLDRDADTCRLAAPAGIEPEWLVEEAGRRIRVLSALGQCPSPFRTRIARTAAGSARLAGPATGERREILLRANGRRSVRDIAFLLGRSLYAVTVEVSRLLDEGLLETVPRTDQPTTPPPPAPPPPGQPSGRPGHARLPQRRPGASGIGDVLPLRPVTGPWEPPPAFLARYRALGGTRWAHEQATRSATGET